MPYNGIQRPGKGVLDFSETLYWLEASRPAPDASVGRQDMTILIDYGILIPFVMSLFFWTRGIWKESKGDLSLGVVLLIYSTLSYLGFPSLVPVSGLPWIFLLLFAVSGVVASLIRRKKHQPTRLLLIATGICLILSVGCYVGEKKWDSSSNSILVIAPYHYAGTWVFDDPRVGLQAEPFVSGIPELIDKLVADAAISNAHDGFRLIFSATGTTRKSTIKKAGCVQHCSSILDEHPKISM
jgi:hypothetical protein